MNQLVQLLVFALVLSFACSADFNSTTLDENSKNVSSTEKSSLDDSWTNFKYEGFSCFKFYLILQVFFKRVFPNNQNDDFKTKFYLTQNETNSVELKHGEQNQFVEFDVTRPTVLIVHGFFANSYERWVHQMATAFNKRERMNVIAVDWEEAAKNILYFPSAVNSRKTAAEINSFVEGIVGEKKSNGSVPVEHWKPLYCVGHSLGAHVCGMAARMINANPNIPQTFKVQRITGLDPANPCFHNNVTGLMLDKSHAPFVDVIHTNVKLDKHFGLGLVQPIGHMDFYPNGGHLQNGCDLTLSLEKMSIFKKIMNTIKFPYLRFRKWFCSHGQGHQYFTESLLMEDKHFSARVWNGSIEQALDFIQKEKCNPLVDDNCVEMGYNAINYTTRGQFFTVTSRQMPFSEPNEEDKQLVSKSLLKLEIDNLFGTNKLSSVENV